ncbi:hypothetical protein Tco_0923083 [Tanacetum coccineum]|uniref:Uncharacterized protein n=1 Tax=Tanacetum coccineum TaxID=301880 RepID=A0ABQ5D753_9ASTR
MSQQNTNPFGDDNAVREGGHNGEILTQEYVRKITEEASEDDHFTRGPWLSAVQYLAAEMLTQEYVRKITEEASEDDHFTRGPWLSAVQYLAAEGSIATGCFGELKTFIKNGKLEKVVAVIKSCTPNMLARLLPHFEHVYLQNTPNRPSTNQSRSRLPYVGEFMPNDPQKRLNLSKPKLPNGETPAGFRGGVRWWQRPETKQSKRYLFYNPLKESVEGQSQLLTSSDDASEVVSNVVSKDDNNENAEVHIEKEHHTSLGSNLLDNADSTVELKRLKKEMKTMEAALLGAARQAQAKADEIAKLMNENEHLKSIISEKSKSYEADIESLREEYHQRASALERKILRFSWILALLAISLVICEV